MYAFGTISLWHVCAIFVLLKEWRAEAKAVAAQEKKRVEEVGWVQSLDITGETEHSHHNCHNSSLFSLCCTMIMRLLPETCTTQSFLGRISISDEWKWYQNKTCTTADLGIWLRLLWTNGPSWTQLDPVLTTSRGGEDGWSGAGRRGAGRVTGWAWEHLGATGSNRHKLSSAGTSWHQDKKLLKETKLWTQLGRRSVGNQESATGRHDNFEENCVDIAWWRTIEHMKALKMVMTCFKRNSGLSSTVRKLRPREKGYYHGRLGTVATSKTKLWRQGRA